MMRGEYLRWAAIVLRLLTGGWLIGRLFWSPPDVQLVAAESEFRAWFWEARGLDIAVQIGLIMAGAVGGAALLPMREEDEP